MIFTTTIRAIDPHTKELSTYRGPNVPGICFSDAQAYCDNNGMGYCEVDGKLVMEMSWNGSNRIDYDNENN